MKKLVLASVSALALLGVAACSDSSDSTTTQSVPDTQMNEPAPAPVDPSTPAAPPAVDDSTTQSIDPAPAAPAPDGSPDGSMTPMDSDGLEPAPAP